MRGAARLLVAWLAPLVACADDPAGPPAGTLADFSGPGDVDVIDFASGRHDTIHVPSGDPTGLSLSLDGAAVAFIVWDANLRRHVYRAELATAEVQEVSPPARGDSIEWGDGFFLYRVRVDGRNGDAVVLDAATEARMAGELTVVASGAPTIAYVFDQQLLVESVLTGERMALAEGGSPVLLTRDGETLLLTRAGEGEEASHLVRHEVDGGAETDLGPYGSTYAGAGRSLLSPDETEVVVNRYEEIVAVRLDGGGERVVWSRREPFTGALHPGFTATGDVVYVVEESLTPDSDTPDILEHLWLERDGESLALMQDARHCNGPDVSGSGALVAWSCEDGTHVFSLADAAEVVALSFPGDVVGFDRDDTGLVIRSWGSEDELLWAPLSGEAQVIASPAVTEPATIDFLP